MSGGDSASVPDVVRPEDPKMRSDDYCMIARLLLVFPDEELVKRGFCYERARVRSLGVRRRALLI